MTAPAALPLRVLIADDEPLARQRIEDLLRNDPNVRIVGTASNGSEAAGAIRSLSPDLVFLDVQMPGKTGLEVVEEIGVETMPATIFVTAYDQFAIRAFDTAAVDYLVKPFDDERFAQALDRARQRIGAAQGEHVRDQLRALLGREERYLRRIAVELPGRVRVVPVAEIDYILASGPYAELHVGDKRYLVREPIQTLEERLDPEEFVRVHRSAIVRVDLVDTLFRGAGGDYEIQLRTGVRLRVSRSRRAELERRIGVLPKARSA